MRTPNTPESYLRHPTSTLLATPGSLRVMRELIDSDTPLATRALADRTGLSTQAVRNTLAALQEGGVVEGLGEGRSRLYRADVNHPLYLPLGGLFQAEEERFRTIVDGLAGALGHLTPAPLAAWIYGTVARGEDGPASDVELALVAADEEVETPVLRLREMLGPIQDVHRIWVSVVGLAPSDVRRLSGKDRWWKSATEPHLAVFGKGPHELAEELERPPRPPGLFRA
ncbi:MAG: HTH domain-containing protein [Gemmatimonadota bacterium]